MKKFSELDASIRNNFVSHIDQRWRQLYELKKEWGEKALKYLFLTNSGGTIAILSFLSATDKSENLGALKVSLFSFALGVFLVGVSTAMIYHNMSWLQKHYSEGVKQFFNDKITWEYLREEDERRSKKKSWNYVAPYASFICFSIGIIAGAIALFP